MRNLTALALLVVPFAFAPPPAGGGLTKALEDAGRALEAGDLPRARTALDRVLERDPNSFAGWELVERWAAKANDRDEEVHALHRELALARTQQKDKAAQEVIRARLLPLDPVADQLGKLRTNFVDKLSKLGEGYEKGKRPHSAIRAFKQALALDPDRADIAATIERIAAAPDPSLAEDARPRDLLEGISADWIREHDEKHSVWVERASMEKKNYVTQTDAGYEVLVRAAESMEQMNSFYRIFFRYGDKPTPRIQLNIFATRQEYLKLGEGPPVEWSGGHYTGSAVETYITGAGFEDTVGTLFHEAAHQFVDLSTNAAGWLNEGMASFFEGSRILANGTVIMNLPANHRLFPLATRMEKGWMSGPTDGIDPSNTEKEPETSPSFRIVLEDKYEWGPPWYEPTWGVVYFLYNFQDPSDGRFVYRKGFGDYVDASGGKSGEGAIKTFEEVVLANPEPVTGGKKSTTPLPKTVDELNDVWKRYILDLRDRQSGLVKESPPYLEWARNALKRGAKDDAAEFFEKALQAGPNDVEVRSAYADFLSERKNDDRASKLLNQALALVENTKPLDAAKVSALEGKLRKVDPSYQRLDDVRSTLVQDVSKILERYLAEGLNLQAMEVSFRLGSELQEPSLYSFYEQAVKSEGHSLTSWRLAYNEEDLKGWNAAGMEEIFKPAGEYLNSKFGVVSDSRNDFSFLTLDEITSGDFSLECELEASVDKVKFAGLVFGRKSALDCNALVLNPPSAEKNGSADLVTFYGSGAFDTLRHNPVQLPKPAGAEAADRTVTRDSSKPSYHLRIDVTGRLVDVWVNGEYLTTHEFPSLDTLRGSFGLITGRGEARFRNVRFLSRHPRDPSATIERKLNLEAKQSTGESINGSWLGLAPPFPSAQRWLQGKRESWKEAVGYPQLLVMFEKNQNDAIPIDAYLRSLYDKNQNIGLRILNLQAFWDTEVAESYIKDHAFPDVVALDTPTLAEHNFGITFEQYEVERFHLPRFILLDIDGKVAWEGDPGFAKGAAWNGEESLLDVPLRELAAKRRLPELIAWRKGWPAARAALARGAFAAAAPALKSMADFDPAFSPEVAEASAVSRAIESAVGSLDDFAAKLATDGREPALEVLIAWAEQLGHPVKKSKAVTTALKNPNVAAWKRAPGMLKPVLPKAGKDPAAIEDVLGKIAALGGAFPAALAERGRAVAGDAAALKALIDDPSALPGEWLAKEHFRWKSEGQ